MNGMTDKLNMQDIIDKLSLQNDLPKEETEKFILELFNAIELGLTSDELTKIKDFGTFKLTLIQERESIDVNTQEKIVIPSHRRVSFLPAQTLKSLVNKPFAHFETTPLNDGIVLENVEQDNASQRSENEDDDLIEDLIEENEALQENVEASILGTSESIGPVNLMSNNAYLDKDIDEDDKEYEKLEETLIDDTSENDITNINDVEEHLIIDSITPKEQIKNAKVISSKPESKPRRPFLPWYIATAIVIIIAIFLVFNFYQPKDNPSKQGVEEGEIPKSIIEASLVVNDTLTEVAVAPTEPLETIQMVVGKTLRLIALDKYGNREFWVYIYLKNKDKIKNPDVVPVGVELVMPNMVEYDINPNSPESVAKAKKLGDEEMKKFW